MTLRFQQVTLTVLCLITFQYGYISHIGLTFPLTCIFHMFSLRAYVIILFPIVVKVLYSKSILLPGTLLLFVEIIVLDKSLYTRILHKLIVLFASVTGIGHYYRGLPMSSYPVKHPVSFPVYPVRYVCLP